MTSLLPPRLSGFSPMLLESLGRCHDRETLCRLFGVSAPLLAVVRKPNTQQHQHVHLLGQGLSLELRCRVKDELLEQYEWGLRSFTLNAKYWAGAWPEGLDPSCHTAEEIVGLLASQPTQALITPDLACFAIDGPEEASWSILAMLDASDGRLKSLSMVHMGEWLETLPMATPS